MNTVLRSVPARVRQSAVLYLIFIIVLLAFGSGCRWEEEIPDTVGPDASKPAPVTADIAKKITHATSGIILTTDDIRVQFGKRYVTLKQAGQPVERDNPVFQFTPWTEGGTYWDDDGRTLIFVPNPPLPRDTAFSCSLDLDALFAQARDKPELGKFQFGFRTGRQEISSLSGEFLPDPDGEPGHAIFAGSVTLTEPAELDEIKGATRITLDKEIKPPSGACGKTNASLPLRSRISAGMRKAMC